VILPVLLLDAHGARENKEAKHGVVTVLVIARFLR
jgi:hypothetical protein